MNQGMYKNAIWKDWPHVGECYRVRNCGGKSAFSRDGFVWTDRYGEAMNRPGGIIRYRGGPFGDTTRDWKMSELKPCPFCGVNTDLGIGMGCEDREGWPTYVYCGECGAHGPWIYTRDKALWTSTMLAAEKTGWNMRANKEGQGDE